MIFPEGFKEDLIEGMETSPLTALRNPICIIRWPFVFFLSIFTVCNDFGLIFAKSKVRD